MQEVYNEKIGSFNKRASTVGVMIKTLLGVLITLVIAITNLANQDLFLSFMYQGSFLYRLVIGLIMTMVIGAVWMVLYRSLYKDKGVILNLAVFLICTVLAGQFMGNALIFAVYFIDYYAGGISTTLVNQALVITFMATIISVVGTIILLPMLKENQKFISFGQNILKITAVLALSSFIIWIVGMILAIFSIDFVLNYYYALFYGMGPIAFIFNILAIFVAEFFLMATIATVKYEIRIGNPKHLEYAYAMSLINAIVKVYVEIFKLVLRVLASQDQD